MSTINKSLLGMLFSGANLVLASASWKNNVRIIYGFNSTGTGYTSFKPGSSFNSLTQLVADGVYIVDSATVGYELPGAVLAAGAPPATAAVINKALMGFLFGGNSPLVLGSAAWKNAVSILYGFNAAGTGYTSFKPTSNFNSLTQLVPDGAYIINSTAPGFSLPGAVVTAGGTIESKKLVILVGNSLLYGQGATAGQEPDKILKTSLGTNYDVLNYAEPGARSDEYFNKAQGQPGGFYGYDTARYTDAICIISGDVNGQAGYGRSTPFTPQQSYDNLKQLHQLAHNKGWKTVQLTDSACGRSYGVATEAAIEDGTQALAVLLRVGLTSATGLNTKWLVDHKLNALGIHIPGSAVLNYFTGDFQHYSDVGYALQNELLAVAVQAAVANVGYGQAVTQGAGDGSAIPALGYSFQNAAFANAKGVGSLGNSIQYSQPYVPGASIISSMAMAIGAIANGQRPGAIKFTVNPANGEFWVGLTEDFAVSHQNAMLTALHYRADVGCRVFGTFSGNSNIDGVYTDVLPNSTGPLQVVILNTGTQLRWYVNNSLVWYANYTATRDLFLAAVLLPGAKVEGVQIGGEQLVAAANVFENPVDVRRHFKQSIGYDASTGAWADQVTKGLPQKDYAVITSATGTKPTVLAGELNGKDVLRFASTAQDGDGLCSLRTKNTVGIAGNQPFQIHAVLRIPSGSNAYFFGLGQPIVPVNGAGIGPKQYVDGWYFNGNFGLLPPNTGVSLANPSGWQNVAFRFDGTTLTVKVNGVVATGPMDVSEMLEALLTLGAGRNYQNYNGVEFHLADFMLSDDSTGVAGFDAKYAANRNEYALPS